MTTPQTTPTGLTFFPVSGYNFAVADPSVSGTVNQPMVQPVSGLVLFTPRLPVGQVLWLPDFLIQAAYSAEQTVNLINNPNQGTFKLQILGTWTTTMPPTVTPAAMQAALITAAGASAGDIVVTSDPVPMAYDVKFAGNLADQPIPIMNAEYSTLMNAQGQGCEVTVEGTSMGGPQISGPTAISIPPLQARIWDGVLSTIDATDTEGFQLVSNMSGFNLPSLIYDVSFDRVTYNDAPGVLAPWAFTAPPDTTPISITDPALNRLPYQPPIPTTWTPPVGALVAVKNETWIAS